MDILTFDLEEEGWDPTIEQLTFSLVYSITFAHRLTNTLDLVSYST